MVTTETSEEVPMVSYLVQRVDEWSREQASRWLDNINNCPNALTCEELTKPLVATGGQVCLQVEWRDGESVWYYTVRSVVDGDDMLVQHHDGEINAARCEAESRLNQDSGHKMSTITPIRRENTPFRS